MQEHPAAVAGERTREGTPGPDGPLGGSGRGRAAVQEEEEAGGQRKHAATYVGSSMAFVVILKRVLKPHSCVKEMKASPNFFWMHRPNEVVQRMLDFLKCTQSFLIARGDGFNWAKKNNT